VRGVCGAALLLLALIALGTQNAHAQASGESAVMTSNSGITARRVKPSRPTMASPASQNTSPHLVAPAGPPPDEVNRKNFEDNAGAKAGKLLFRSVPSGAEIFINDLLVGRTPLLMLIAPGKYKIDMRGPRQEMGHRMVGIMPKEIQTVLINLSQRYPVSVTIR
jgi:hypothetical protein